MRISDWSSDVCSSDLDLRPVFYIVGFLLIILAVAMLVPLATDLIVGHEDWTTFAISALVTLFIGGALVFTCYQPRSEERRVGKECGRTCRYRWSQYH